MRNHRFLRRKAASDYLHETHGLDRAPSTLAKLAVIGGGPIFQRIGRVPLYATDDLDKWVASKLSAPMRSTSDVASPKEVTAICHQQAGLGGELIPAELPPNDVKTGIGGTNPAGFDTRKTRGVP
jgi:hypothetical protein